MAGHTNGPWKVTGELSNVEGHVLWCGDIEPESSTYIGRIAHVQSCDHICGIPQAESEANARLIAAAPDLLAALEQAQRIIERDFPHGQLAIDIRAAMHLAKHGAAPATTNEEAA